MLFLKLVAAFMNLAPALPPSKTTLAALGHSLVTFDLELVRHVPNAFQIVIDRSSQCVLPAEL